MCVNGTSPVSTCEKAVAFSATKPATPALPRRIKSRRFMVCPSPSVIQEMVRGRHEAGVATATGLRELGDGQPPSIPYALPRQQHSLFQVTGHVRIRSGVRVVRHHHDCLVEILVEAFENLQHFGGGVAVEGAGGVAGGVK